MLPTAMAAVTQKWTFSRLKGSSAVHVGLEEQSQKRSWYMKCVQTGHLASMIQDVPFKTRHLTQASQIQPQHSKQSVSVLRVYYLILLILFNSCTVRSSIYKTSLHIA